jgi:uncharacterized protein (DUF58 family)
MKSRKINLGLRIRPGGNFWGLSATAVFLFFSRWLFDEIYFLNTLYVIIIYLVLAFIYSLFVLDFISIERKFKNRQWKVGDQFDEEISITNRSILPIFWMEIRDHSGIRQKPFQHITGGFRQRRKHVIRNSCYLERRGKILLGPVEVLTSDPMACFAVAKQVQMNGFIVARPYRIDLATGKFRKNDTESGRTSRFTLQNSDISSSSVRPYMAGDPLNRIHWATTARRGVIHSRHQDVSLEQTTWILLDCQSTAHNNTLKANEKEIGPRSNFEPENNSFQLPRDTFETAVSITCTIADSWLRKGIAVGLALNQQPEFLLNPGHGSRQLTEMLETLTYVRGISQYPVSQLLRSLSTRINPGQICYLVTTDLSGETSKACGEVLNRNIDLRIIQIIRSSFEEQSNPGNKGAILLPKRSLEFRYGDDFMKLKEIL